VNHCDHTFTRPTDTGKLENTSGHPVQHNIRISVYIVPSREEHDDVSPAINIRRRRRADLNAYSRDAHKRCSDNARSPDSTKILYYTFKSLGNTHTRRGRSEANPCVYIIISCRYISSSAGGGGSKGLGVFLLYVGLLMYKM